MNPTNIQIIGASLFAVAVLHTFSTKFFEKLAHTRPAHAGLCHLLGEVEVVFGLWAAVLMVAMFATEGKTAATHYLDTRNFTEPLFVFAIMVAAASKPILQGAGWVTRMLAQSLPLAPGRSFTLVTLTLVPLMGSFITEPAAMTLAALLLRDGLYSQSISNKLKYAVLGVLFVNVSIGGTLTPYAAPPVLMVASAWGWDLAFMFLNFGDKAALAVFINAMGLVLMFSRELKALPPLAQTTEAQPPLTITLIHVFFLAGIVVFAHHPSVFLGLFMLFLGFTAAYERYQSPLILREGLLVAFFLAGLVVLGGQQQWWLEPLLLKMDANAVFFGATALTAITDNAALTYLGSLVPGLSDEFKYALVAGAVTGGGLTIIANAPNPAGAAILKGKFPDQAIHAGGLLLAALPPTIVALLCFKLI
ncbi:MAG: putative Na+/H+ antiporter [Aquabacterium sp.]|uniref:putative Na+/H+ antiporter n=1 Tax=Aquabacterium sp. TaxID=1872578 RepID=UPI0025C1A26B|nr:putative Na+/H+ antiporter [Aquabacterium sp.]MBI5927189.1 putative Na+/H+ antiporter [Aquabacterium sp.]